MTFSDLGLSAEVLRAVSDAGYETPTPIQQKAIPHVLMGRDILGCAQTGTGKTAGFTLPMIDILAQGRARARMPRSLILEPTRELAAQVAENFEIYGKYNKLTKALLIGGVSYDDQEKLLDRGVDVLIATPGRLLDHFERGRILLNDVNILVIDEADRMLDMGFIPDVERIVSLLPKKRQTLFFSATMPPEIKRLADAFLSEPREITVAPPASPAATVTQGLAIVPHADHAKRDALRRLIAAETVRNALIFCNRKRDVDTLYKSLKRHGFSVGSLHGDMDQGTRTQTLDAFKRGEMTLLVCSDVAARGLDIDDLSHVFNFDVPIHAEDYVHRIGRTGRAGRSGRAFTLGTGEDRRYIDAIERLISKAIPRITIEGVAAASAEPTADEAEQGRPSRGQRGRRGGQGGAPRGRSRGDDRVHDQAAPPQHEKPPVRADKPHGPSPLPHHPFDDAHANPAAAAAAAHTNHANGKKHPAHPQARAEERPHHEDRHHQRRGREERDDGPAQVGLGDHMPAFLMRGRRAIG
ncbi:MAG TPA: DEAD/DEAH box helicase [Alphaproteobacteria bacterium]